jgi:hypothetical protein
MINIMFKNVDLNDKWWIELIKTINYFRNRFSMIDRSIILYEIDTRKKLFFAHFRRIETIDYAETKIDHEMRKNNLQIVFDRSREVRKRSHLSNITSQRNHLSCFVDHLKTMKKHSHDVEISIETSSKRSAFESFNSSTKKQILKSNSITIFISTQISQAKTSSFSFSSSIIEINTSFNDFVSMILLTLNSLKRHFELRYRLNSFDSLNLLIMRCMQNVTNSQHALKSRSYKKIMNDFNRDEWLTIMKNENKSFLTNEIWILTNLFRNKRVFRDKWIYKIKREKHDEILRYKTRWMIRDFEQIERLNYMKTFVSMIKSMSYKTMYVIIVVNDWKIKQMNVKIVFLYDKIYEKIYVAQFTDFEQNVNQICKLNKTLYDLKQFSRIWFEILAKFLFFLDYVSLNVEFNVFMRYLCKRFDFYKTRSRDYFSIEKRSKRTIWDEWLKALHLLSRHENLQKSSSQIINSESKRLRRADITRSWNVRLQIFDHSHERLLSIDQDLWWIHRWQKSQNKLSISREIINVRHARNQIWYNLFNLNDQSLCF